jgi:hypothetical protein
MIGLEAVIGAAMPVIIEFIAKYVKSSSGKFIVSLILPLIAGVVLNFNGMSFENVEAILASGAIIFTAAQGVYKLFFKDSVLQRKINS